jgi:DNA-binding NarL/FixJ family response regulator
MADASASVAVITVVIADDDPDMQVLIRSVLSLDQRITISGVASHGGEALELFDRLRPDVLVLDERMPVHYGLEVAAQVLAEHPQQRVILCSAFVDESVTARAQELGVRTVLGKEQLHLLAEEIVRLAG